MNDVFHYAHASFLDWSKLRLSVLEALWHFIRLEQGPFQSPRWSVLSYTTSFAKMI